MSIRPDLSHPHQGQPALTAGAPPGEARAAMILVHGRGGSASDMLGLIESLGHPEFHYIAPQAAGNTWYPNSFLAPIPSNEPYLSSALDAVDGLLTRLEENGIPAERTILLGFSQGACLALELAFRHPRRYGGVVGLSGALISPPGTTSSGDLARTALFLGCSDRDFHIPEERVRQSAEMLQLIGGDVTMRIYSGMGHTVNQDEIAFVRSLMDTQTMSP